MGGLALESKRAGFINARFEHDARFKVLIDDLRRLPRARKSRTINDFNFNRGQRLGATRGLLAPGHGEIVLDMRMRIYSIEQIIIRLAVADEMQHLGRHRGAHCALG